jgi:hypothetical protein
MIRINAHKVLPSSKRSPATNAAANDVWRTRRRRKRFGIQKVPLIAQATLILSIGINKTNWQIFVRNFATSVKPAACNECNAGANAELMSHRA